MTPCQKVQQAYLTSFEPPDRAGALAPDEVHVWRADLASTDPGELELLRGAELARAAPFAHARAILRQLLARYTGLDPGSLQLERGVHGKLALVQDGPAFNLSHSGELALYAFSGGGEVGIDVELIRPRRWSPTLAERAFGVEHARRLEALAPTPRRIEFLHLWVRREAAAKCSGEGLFEGAGGAWADDLGLIEIDLGDALAALACRPGPKTVRCFAWPGRANRFEKARIRFLAA